LRVTALMLGIAAGADASAGGYVGLRGGGSDANEGLGESGGFGELFGGYRIDDRWAIEAGYIARDASVPAPADPLDDESRFRALALTARTDFALSDRTTLHLRGGLAATHVEYDLRLRSVASDSAGNVTTEDVTIRSDEHDVGWLVAAGVDYRLGERWSLVAELQHLVGEYSIGCRATFPALCDSQGSDHITLAGLSLTARF
jgi:opacity protein-like surface antigen